MRKTSLLILMLGFWSLALLPAQSSRPRSSHAASTKKLSDFDQPRNSLSIDLYTPILTAFKSLDYRPWSLQMTREALPSKKHRTTRAWRYGVLGMARHVVLSVGGVLHDSEIWKIGAYGGHQWSFPLGQRFSFLTGLDIPIYYGQDQDLETENLEYGSDQTVETRTENASVTAMISPFIQVGFLISPSWSCALGLRFSVVFMSTQSSRKSLDPIRKETLHDHYQRFSFGGYASPEILITYRF